MSETIVFLFTQSSSLLLLTHSLTPFIMLLQLPIALQTARVQQNNTESLSKVLNGVIVSVRVGHIHMIDPLAFSCKCCFLILLEGMRERERERLAQDNDQKCVLTRLRTPRTRLVNGRTNGSNTASTVE